MLTIPSTELDAINEMLGVIGESPISTLADNGLADAAIAQQILTSVSRSVQARGWHFNTEKDYTLTPSFPLKELVLPSNTLKVDSTGADYYTDVTQRGLRLYDRKNHTYAFKSPLKVELVLFLPFDELPETGRYYITLRSARMFQERLIGAQELSGFTSRDEVEAKMAFVDANSESADYNVLTGSPILERH